jgi:hypothetical protein
LRVPVEDTRAATPHSSPPRAARRRGQQRDKPPSTIRKILACFLGYVSPNTPLMWRLSMKDAKERKSPNQWKKYALTWTCSLLVLTLHPRVKKSLRLSPLKKELLDFKMSLRCSSGMEKQASVVSVLTMVAWPAHPPLTHLLLIPLLWLTLMMMMKKRKANKTTTSEASKRPPPHLFVLNNKGGEISIKTSRLNSVCFSFCSVWKTELSDFVRHNFLSIFLFPNSSGLENYVICERLCVKACNTYLNLNYACFLCHVILYLIYVNFMQICIFECLKCNDECFLVNMLSLEKPKVSVLLVLLVMNSKRDEVARFNIVQAQVKGVGFIFNL